MKTSKLVFAAIALMSFIFVSFGCDAGVDNFLTSIVAASSEDEMGSDTVLTESEFTEDEWHDLLHLAEEEKLARDVYIYAYAKYALPVFNNISKSEQYHMERVLEILASFDVEDPTSPVLGDFNNEELQALYDQLTSRVDISLLDALLVGATIEDLDINDINSFIANTDNTEMLGMYTSLNCGSRNHMRAFYRQLQLRDQTYTPVFISQDEFDAVINSDGERCGVER